jgi:hypothetical protein
MGFHEARQNTADVAAIRSTPVYIELRLTGAGHRLMALPLHPFMRGLQFRIKYLDNLLEHICGMSEPADDQRQYRRLGSVSIIIPRHRRQETG